MTEENLRKNSRETGAFPFLRRLTLCIQRGLIKILKSIMKRLCRRKRKNQKKKAKHLNSSNNASGGAHIYCKGRGICCCKVLATHDG